MHYNDRQKTGIFQSQQHLLVMFSPCESVCVLVCVIMVKSGPGDTYFNSNRHISNFEYFARCLYVCLSVCGQILSS